MDLLRLWRLERPAQRPEVAPPPALYAYVGGWVIAAVLLAVAVVDVQAGLLDSPWELVAMAAAVFFADSVSVTLQHSRSAEFVTVIDVAVALVILSLPPTMVVVAVFAGVLLNHGALRRLSPIKALFNSSQHAVAAGLGALALAPLSERTGAFTVGLLGMSAVALVVYFLVGGLAMAGIFRLFGEPKPLRTFFARAPFLGVTVFGNGVAGLLAYALLQTNPVTFPLLISPIVAMQLAYRGTARSERLLSEVRIERDRLDRVIAGASEGIVLLDADGQVLVWNDAMEAITGRSSEDAVGRQATEVMAGDDADGLEVDPSIPVRLNDHAVYEVSLTSVVEGVDPPVVQMSHAIVTDNEEVIGDVVVVRDLSRERAATSLKEDFVARVSHELRTPLTPIRGYAQTLLSHGEQIDTTKRTEVLERIVERVGHLERLIEDLLLVSRISSGSVTDLDEVTPAPFEPGPLVSRLVEWFERDHADRPFTIEVDDGLPAAWGDAFRAGQIVTNLLSNACKYSPVGTPVDVRVAHADGRLQVSVTDQGRGIARDQLETVFDRFQRLEDPQRMKTGGIGLGLYISRHLAERMGGSLTVDSQLGAGSTFTLSLGLSADVEPGVQPGAQPRPSGIRRRPAHAPVAKSA